jgi:hypothetical protein
VSQAMFVWRHWETLEVCVGLNLFVREEHRTLDVCVCGIAAVCGGCSHCHPISISNLEFYIVN